MIYLREITSSDIPLISCYRSDHKLIDHLGTSFRYTNLETDENWFQSYLKNRSYNVRCAICLSESDEMIGVAYLLNIDWIARNAEFAISIWASKYRDKGIGKKASNLLLNHGFYDLNLHKIYLAVIEKNVRAIELYKKLGFNLEGIMREAVFKDNTYHNLVMMGILREEYTNMK